MAWAQVTTVRDTANAVRVAEGLTFDRAYRCASPFRLSPPVPAGTRFAGCDMTFGDPGRPVRGIPNVDLYVGEFRMTIGVMAATAALPAVNTTINGRPAYVREFTADNGYDLMQVSIAFPDHVVEITGQPGYQRAAVLRLAEAYQPVGGDDPAGWPADPIGG